MILKPSIPPVPCATASQPALPPRVSKTSDEALRRHIVEWMADPEIDGKILVENMERVFQWVRKGAQPGDKHK